MRILTTTSESPLVGHGHDFCVRNKATTTGQFKTVAMSLQKIIKEMVAWLKAQRSRRVPEEVSAADLRVGGQSTAQTLHSAFPQFEIATQTCCTR